jgi:uroporphyrinogen decarboxylase
VKDEPDTDRTAYAISMPGSTDLSLSVVVLASPPMAPLGRLERLQATARREPVDRPAYAFWRHFPSADRSPAALAQATLRFQDRYGSDFLAVVPPAGYAAAAWGCVEGDTPGVDGSRVCARCAVIRPEDWRGVQALDPTAAPGFSEVLETLVRVGFDRRIGDAPVVVALPAPSAVATRLGGGRLALHVREWPGLVGDALRAIAETQTRFAELCLAEGLAGVLYEIRALAEPALDPATYSDLIEPHDRVVLTALDGRATWRVVHLAGPVAFARIAEWPFDALAWAPGNGLPVLANGHARLQTAALGGLDARALRDEPPAGAVLAARTALASVGDRGLIVGPGGPVWPDTPDAVLAAVIRAIGGSTRPILGLTR